MKKRYFKPDKFIKTIFVKQIGKIVESNYHYLSFALISQGIELLGTIIEDDLKNDFDTKGISRKRFRLGLELMGNPEYLRHCAEKNADATEFDLYKHLRCGFAHQLRPTGKIGLTHDEEMMIEKTKHLRTNKEGMLVLNIDTLYKDFNQACKKVIEKIQNNELVHDKAYRIFLSVDSKE